jgi:hypothetical protein
LLIRQADWCGELIESANNRCGRLILQMRSFGFVWWSCRWPHGGRQLSVFKPVDLHRRYPQQGRRWGSPWSGTRRSARGHKTQDLYMFG